MTKNKLKNTIKGSPITSALIISNVVIYLYSIIHKIIYKTPLYYYFAMHGPSIKNYHEYYRLITNMFIHFDILHILLNMIALWILGSFLENYIKPIKFAIIYFASGILGSIAIYLFNYNTLTAGASGAIYGLMMAILMLTFIRQNDFNELAIRNIRLTVLINFALTFAMANVSIAGHIGGSLGGLLIFLFVKPDKSNITFKDDDEDVYWS